MYKKMRSLTPDFRKKRFSCFWGQITHIREKSIFVDVRTPFSRQGGPPEKKYHLESGLNQRDRARQKVPTTQVPAFPRMAEI